MLVSSFISWCTSALISALTSGSTTGSSLCAGNSSLTAFALIVSNASARDGLRGASDSCAVTGVATAISAFVTSSVGAVASAGFSRSGRGPRLRGVVFLGRWLAGRRENSEFVFSSSAAKSFSAVF